METEPTWVLVGKVRKPFGLKGEVSVEIFGETNDRFTPGQTVHLNLRGDRRRLVVSRLRALPGKTLVFFEGVENVDQVEEWRGGVFEVPADEIPPHDPGGYYYYQLLGLEVRDARGAVVGTIRDVQENAGGTLLTIRGEGKEHLVPFAKAIVQTVDLEEGVMTLADVEGLLDL